MVADEDSQSQIESISERRVRMYRTRESIANSVASVLTTTGAVEALSAQTSLQGIAALLVGLYLEKNAKDPGTLSLLLVIPVVFPSLYRAYNIPKEELVSAMQAFIFALKGYCFVNAFRLLFIGRRLRQLGAIRNQKDVD